MFQKLEWQGHGTRGGDTGGQPQGDFGNHLTAWHLTGMRLGMQRLEQVKSSSQRFWCFLHSHPDQNCDPVQMARCSRKFGIKRENLVGATMKVGNEEFSSWLSG